MVPEAAPEKQFICSPTRNRARTPLPVPRAGGGSRRKYVGGRLQSWLACHSRAHPPRLSVHSLRPRFRGPAVRRIHLPMAPRGASAAGSSFATEAAVACARVAHESPRRSCDCVCRCSAVALGSGVAIGRSACHFRFSSSRLECVCVRRRCVSGVCRVRSHGPVACCPFRCLRTQADTRSHGEQDLSRLVRSGFPPEKLARAGIELPERRLSIPRWQCSS